ncbi:MAG TPA: HAD family phosphatase [Solirubrobacteraceae bacterium]|nr:HAD family phosphatase [Solirubrobacteraceae bacterium]
MIRAVISDFGGVLTSPIAGSFQAFADRSGITLAMMGQTLQALHERDGSHPLHELECGRISETMFASSLESALCDAAGHEVSLAGFSELLGELLPNEPMIELMASLRDEGYKMALLTNNVREWEQHWRAMAPIDELFEVVVDSAFVGMRKPDAEIYELCIERLGVQAQECLFVDDRQDNCAGAEAVGMAAVRYRDAEQAVKEIRAALGRGHSNS